MSPRRMEEASVAGEPDKSEQRESSGTAEERDPRFAVFREPAAAADSGSTAGRTTGAVTDTATAVFRAPHLADAESGTQATGTGRDSSSRDASRPGDDSEAGTKAREGGSTARGERGAPDGASRAPEDASGASGGASAASADGSGAEEARPDASEAVDEREGTAKGPAPVSAEPVAGASSDDGPASAARAEAGPEGRADAQPGSGSDSGSDSGSGSATAAEAATGTGPEEGSEPSDQAGAASSEARSDADTEPEVGAVTESDADADVDADADTDTESETETDKDVGTGEDSQAAPNDARLRAAVAAWVAGDDEGTTPRAGADGDEATAEARDATARAGVADGAKTDDATAAFRVPKTRSEASVATGADREPAEAKPAEAKPAEAEPAEPADAESAADRRGIDQPTTALKALRPDRVDQPTTALKLPPPAKKAQPAPETPAERTSKFVPLRSDDVKPPRRPGSSLPPVGPTVTPDLTAGTGSPAGPAGPATGLTEAERTRQQPMPPKPPLDLLAELTNTPPPPETPVRTAVRRVKIWTPLVLLALVVFAIAQAVRPLPEPGLALTAKSSYAFEGGKPTLPWPGEGQGYMAATGLGTVDSFGEQEPVPIGSVAKAMTAYIVLRDHPLKKGEDGPAIKIDAKAEADGKLDSEGESTLNTVKAGDTLTQQEALAAIMIPSANNIARLLARWDAGSEQAFVEKMNDTAEELGMKNTTYTDPSGLNATTVSSAEDQVKLGQELVEIPALMDITKLPSWTDPSGHSWRNYNTLVPYNGALGIKTGSTTKAGGNLLFAAHKMVGDTDQLIVGAVLGQHKPSIIDTVNAVSKEVMLATQDLLESRTIVKKGQVVGTVDDGFGGTTDVVAAEDVTAVGWPGLTVELELTDDGKTIPNSAAAGTRVGTMTVGEGASQVKVAVVLDSALADPTFGEKLTRIS
ncbi:hypothetical protein [Streptomyces sp. B1I3]|uniref:hypothetical protein n=1 Tax=Streptomyces sp. B1I3 TaxID=3042264 RepID=UPI00278A211F|nr:hypothetical protein [Streptomyces sp. B1I3]MDQ0795824.1 D-alanyl-D-alanine carboxypeptidase (penicillin-binding protein 5/6) [Streptomyces sp. B1I3]